MKDKLYKNHHRGIYYRVKIFFFIFAVFSGAMAIAIIPTYLVLKEGVKEPTHATVEEVVEDPKEDHNPEEAPEQTLLSYL